MSSGKTQEEVLDSLISNATTNTAVAVMDIKDTMVQNLKNGTGLGTVPTIEELTAARKRRKEKSSKKGFSKKEESRRENAIKGHAPLGGTCANDAGTGSDQRYICSSSAGQGRYCKGYTANVSWGACRAKNHNGTAGPGAACAHDAGTGGGDMKYICKEGASSYCKGYEANKNWGECTRRGVLNYGDSIRLKNMYAPAAGAHPHGTYLSVFGGHPLGGSNNMYGVSTLDPNINTHHMKTPRGGPHRGATVAVWKIWTAQDNDHADGRKTDAGPVKYGDKIKIESAMGGPHSNEDGTGYAGWLNVDGGAKHGSKTTSGGEPSTHTQEAWDVSTIKDSNTGRLNHEVSTWILKHETKADGQWVDYGDEFRIETVYGSNQKGSIYTWGIAKHSMLESEGYGAMAGPSSHYSSYPKVAMWTAETWRHTEINHMISLQPSWGNSYFWIPRGVLEALGGEYPDGKITSSATHPATIGVLHDSVRYIGADGETHTGPMRFWSMSNATNPEYVVFPQQSGVMGRWEEGKDSGTPPLIFKDRGTLSTYVAPTGVSGYTVTQGLNCATGIPLLKTVPAATSAQACATACTNYKTSGGGQVECSGFIHEPGVNCWLRVIENIAACASSPTGSDRFNTYIRDTVPQGVVGRINHVGVLNDAAQPGHSKYVGITKDTYDAMGGTAVGEAAAGGADYKDGHVKYTSPGSTVSYGTMRFWKKPRQASGALGLHWQTGLPVGSYMGRWEPKLTPVSGFEVGGSIVKITAAQLATYKEDAAATAVSVGTDTATAIAAGYTKVKENTGYCREEIGQPRVHTVAHATRTMAEFIEACEADTTCTHFHTCCADNSGATTVYWGNLVTSCANVNKWNPPNPDKGQPRGSLDTAYTIYRKQGATVDPLTLYDGRSESQKLVANMDAPPPGYAIQVGMYLGGCIPGDACTDYTTIDAAATSCNSRGSACSGIAKKTTGVYEIRASPPALLETGTTELSYVKNPPISDAGGTAMAWAQNRVNNALAIAGRTCTQQGPKAVCPVDGAGGHGVDACDARKDMFDDLQNPILRNLVINDGNNPGGAPPHLQLRTESGTLNPKGIGWLRIPTSNVNNLVGGWSNPIQDNVDGQKYEPETDVSLSYITLLIANKYTAPQCKEIFNILSPEGTIYAPKLSTGRGFIFTKEGHIRIWQDGGTKNDVMYNPFINMADATGDDDASGKTDNVGDRLQFGTVRTDLINTMAQAAGAQGIGSYTAGTRINGPLFAMSSRIVMNKALTYILYTPDITPSETSQYYLLYNPIHGEEFKRFYQSILQAKKTEETGPRYTSSWGNGNAYPVDRIRAYDRGDCLSSIEVPSYTRIIARYCNAFKIPGHVATVSGSEVSHYADPLCPVMMGTTSAIFHFALGHNMTHESLRRKYYRLSRTDTYKEGYDQFMMAANQFQGGQHPATSMSWACDNHGISGASKDIQDYMSDIGMFHKNNTSFIQIMGHAIVNRQTAWVNDDTKQAIYRRVSSAATRDGAASATVDAAIAAEAAAKADSLGKPVCLVAAKSFTSCTNTINVAGSVSDSNLGQSSVCGPQPAHIAAGTTPSLTDEEICEANPESCVDKHDCETAEGSEEVGTGPANAIMQYSGCCYGEYDGELLGAKPSGGCGGTAAGSSEANQLKEVPTNKSSAATITVMVEGLMEKIAKAGKVGTTAKTAYPTDLVIGAAAEEISSKLASGVALGVAVTGDLDAVTAVISDENTAALGKAREDADKLAIVSTDLEKLGSDMAILIATTYMFGIKKMYLIGGAIGLVVLILLIVLLKK